MNEQIQNLNLNVGINVNVYTYIDIHTCTICTRVLYIAVQGIVYRRV